MFALPSACWQVTAFTSHTIAAGFAAVLPYMCFPWLRKLTVKVPQGHKHSQRVNKSKVQFARIAMSCKATGKSFLLRELSMTDGYLGNFECLQNDAT